MSEEEKINQLADNSFQSPQNNPENSELEVVNENQTSEIKNMEVHKHPHHVTHKKKWGEYLLEFFMLFLAVFLGFVAENVRETIVEKERSKQYIESFCNDLEKDTATFSKIIANDEKKNEAFQHIFNCYDTIKKNWKATACLVPLVRQSRTNQNVAFSNGTIQQLKNAGGYRLLNHADRDSIIAYDNSIQSYLHFESTAFQESQNLLRISFSMINDFSSNKFLNKSQAGKDSTDVEMPLLITDDKFLINKFFNDLFRYKVYNAGQATQLRVRKEMAKRLILYFKNKYHLE